VQCECFANAKCLEQNHGNQASMFGVLCNFEEADGLFRREWHSPGRLNHARPVDQLGDVAWHQIPALGLLERS
jgi:hypothetical protein